MKICIYNAEILMGEPFGSTVRGEVLIEGENIVYAGVSGTAEAESARSSLSENGGFDRQINAEGNLLIPGFKNCHTHSAMTFLRSFADDLPLQSWLQEKVFPMEARLQGDDIYHLTKLAILEYLSGGTTAAFDMYLDPDQTARAARDCGFRMVLAGGLNDFTSSLEKEEAFYIKYNKPHDLVSYQLGFHAEYTTSLSKLEGMADLAEKYQAPVFMHNSETIRETEDCKRRYGKTPTALFDSLGIYNYGGGGYHCIYMSEEDLDIFSGRKLWAVTNPSSNLKLASGIFPLQEMIKRRIPVAIGTDGPASNNCLDMFREMFLVTALSKLRQQDAGAADADRILEMAVSGGAHAMGLPQCDSIRAGKLADLVMIDLQQPNMQPLHKISKNLVYSGSKSNVKMTMVNGRILYEDGQYNVGEDVQEIYRNANQITERICRGG